jgi:hypothetical protein
MPSSLEKLIVAIDAPLVDIVWRAAVGFFFLPNYFSLVGADSWWLLVACLLLVLLAMRIGAGVARSVLPFSRSAKQTWAARRTVGKEYDSYQWRKLVGFGVGMVGYLALQRQPNPTAWVLAAVVLAAGFVGSLFWWRVREVAFTANPTAAKV